MREILFRGKVEETGDWVEGFYTRLYDCKGNYSDRIYTGYAETDCGDFYPEVFEITSKTVGQFTGLTDKNGKKIFEGDIHERENHFFVVKYGKYRDCETGEDGYGWYFEYTHRKGCEGFNGTESGYVNIIGNIHDNPELMKGDAK